MIQQQVEAAQGRSNVLAYVALLDIFCKTGATRRRQCPLKEADDMTKSTKPDFLTDERLLACLMFLSKLRKSGVTNMFEIRLKLRHAFPDLTTSQVAEVVRYWMQTFAAA